MDFTTAVTTVFTKYADFEGRATRPEYWWFILFSILVSMALGALNFQAPNGTVTFGSSLAAFWSIITLVPTLAVGVRRLRDAGRAWTNLFWLFLPILGVIILIIYLAEPSKRK